MGRFALICAFVLFARAESYVLLTANVDDLHAMANQLSKSPVVQQLKEIWRRASKTFNSQYSKFRAVDSDEDASKDGESPVMRSHRRKAINHLVELGRNASIYLKEMFDNL
ncbi:uncharacterized protein LOC125236012 [Leguminivora glycinivorella]|uniref:uncharacterized protein LOC125236012 n=1 Tax=Leguminivora glycinivorella TaxID=1035111 RepID=UPI00200D533D|nr:uncharacterized protein LOC125236012 [Leguminivora glycinivorella]